MTDPTDIRNQIQELALASGFDLCGFTDEFRPRHADYFLKWLAENKNGEMAWLANHQEKRLNPSLLFDGCRSVICLGINYQHDETPKMGKIARYAFGEDYHHWMKTKIETLIGEIQNKIAPDFKARCFVDAAPVLERDLATKSGIGWVGKNTCLINTQVGSYVFLGEIFCNLSLTPATPSLDHCGKCRLCIDACPTQALTPYQLDANKCLAYVTIEKRGPRPKEFYAATSDWLVGCDICQEVCPWNHKAPATQQSDWLKGFDADAFGQLETYLSWERADYRQYFDATAVSRIKYEDFMRNVFVAIGNLGSQKLLSSVEAWQKSHAGMCVEEWQWCVERLTGLSGVVGDS